MTATISDGRGSIVVRARHFSRAAAEGAVRDLVPAAVFLVKGLIL